MAEGKIYEAIIGVMKDVGAVGKNNTNQIQKYKFRGIDDVMNALNPAMIKNHVFVTPTIIEETREERQTGKGGLLIYSVVKVKYTFYTDDGSSVEATVIGEAMDSGDKSMNKAMSAGFKYACFQVFCIPTEEMHDSEEDSPEPVKKQIGKSINELPQKTEEQLNAEMVNSVDPRLLPTEDDVMSKAQYDFLMEQIERTGAKEDVVKYAKTDDLSKLNSKKCVAILVGLLKRPNKE